MKSKIIDFKMMRGVAKNSSLVWDMAKNDLKARYSGSWLGVTWAFIQPLMTIVVFWFVFQVGFRSSSVESVPFICWFAAGLTPWFFFSDAWMNGGNVFLEYNYLIKKMVFKISMLPVIKIMSSIFIHAVFVIFLLIIYLSYGIYPEFIWIQLIYYSLCMVPLLVGLTLITASITPFFKDMSSVVSILLQFGMWLTPIMWSYKRVPSNYLIFFKINPMYYVVEGYRDTLINHVWFWNRYNQTAWFWITTMIILVMGVILYRKLKPHFSDVL